MNKRVLFIGGSPCSGKITVSEPEILWDTKLKLGGFYHGCDTMYHESAQLSWRIYK